MKFSADPITRFFRLRGTAAGGVFTKAHHLPIQITTSERIEQTVLEEGKGRHQNRCRKAPRKHGSLSADNYFYFFVFLVFFQKKEGNIMTLRERGRPTFGWDLPDRRPPNISS